MPFHESDNIRYYSFETLDIHGVVNAAICRTGGVSPKPWFSLNVGGTVGDEAERVAENRKRSFDAVGMSLMNMFDVWQVHGKDVVKVDQPRQTHWPRQQADIMITDQPGVVLFMRFADCVPIYLYDPQRKAIALAHAGWKGTIMRIPAIAVESMAQQFGTQPEDLVAGIGPSIGQHHYEIGPEVIARVRQAFGEEANSLLAPTSETSEETSAKFDLWSANRLILEHAGVRQVELSEICTACHTQDWFSHRGENGKTGRFGALLSLPGE